MIWLADRLRPTFKKDLVLLMAILLSGCDRGVGEHLTMDKFYTRAGNGPWCTLDEEKMFIACEYFDEMHCIRHLPGHFENPLEGPICVPNPGRK